MRYIIQDSTLDDIQETAVAILYSADILVNLLVDMQPNIDDSESTISKEALLGQADAIRIMAKQLDLNCALADMVQ